MDLDAAFTDWKAATAELPWGTKRAFREVLSAVADGQVTTLVYSADYNDGGACLVNSAAQMLVTGGGNGVPSKNFGRVVGLFDSINRELYNRGVNTERGKVSALAGEVLIRHFADVSNDPEFAANEDITAIAQAVDVYVEPSDDDLMQDWLTASTQEPVSNQPDNVVPLKRGNA